ncbi:hypothetical protein D3C81_2095880 [compost metagenome]
MLLLETFEQLDIAKQKVIDQVVQYFAEFVAHLFSLLVRVGLSVFLGDLDQVATGVIEHGHGDGA